jgi:hypothetical protein
MEIQCKICDQKFKSIITNSHLKKHGITTSEYKEKYGPLSSKEYREKRSIQYSGENNPMYNKSHSTDTINKISSNRKGKLGRVGAYSEQGLKAIQEAVEKREERYNNGELSRPTRNKLGKDTKDKIAKSVSEYAQNNPEKLSERGKLAHKSAKSAGNWEHPMERLKVNDPEKYARCLEQSKETIKKANEERSKKLKKAIEEKIAEYNLVLIDETKTEQSKLWLYTLLCKNCDTEFKFTRQYFTDSKCTSKICPTCYPRKSNVSKSEAEIFEYVTTLCDQAISNDRTILNGREIDIYCPNEKLAIEFNGLYWHSESVLTHTGRDKLSDYLKYKTLKEQGIQLITIFEDEWINRPSVVKSILRSKFNKMNTRIYARKCSVREIDVKEAKVFLNSYHLQGYNKSKVKVGLYYEDELVSVMTFSTHNLSRKSYCWEIDRYAVKEGLIVVGGASKLFKHFVQLYDPEEVLSYADNRWSSGNLYHSLEFIKEKDTNPNYWYFLPNEMKRIHRFTLRKNSNDIQTLTEYENRLKQGYYRIWDCGSSKWIWKK